MFTSLSSMTEVPLPPKNKKNKNKCTYLQKVCTLKPLFLKLMERVCIKGDK